MILVKTEAGHQVLKDRSIRLTPRQRSAFILFDGKRTVTEVLDAGVGISREEIDQLVELRLLGEAGAPSTAAVDIVAAPSGVARAPLNGSAEMNGAPGVTLTQPAPPAPTAQQPSANSSRSSQQRYKDAYPIATQLTGTLGLRGFRLNLSVEGTSTYDELLELLPKIVAAVGPEKSAALQRALTD